MHKWYQEPLLHFFLIGVIIFYISYEHQPKEEVQLKKHLTVSNSTINELVSDWKQRKNALPTQIELDKSLEYYIEDEILYQEALRMKLDVDEPDIKQILINKLKYIAHDSINIDEIDEETLHNYFQKHKESFIKKDRKIISFTHIYFNPKMNNRDINETANALYRKINTMTYENNTSTLGDKFYAGNHFENMDKKSLSNFFSRSFIRELFQLPEKKWSKPIKSGFGIHIIYIEEKISKKELTFTDVKDEVKNEWLIEQNYNAYKTLYKKLREKYTITIETNNSRDTN